MFAFSCDKGMIPYSELRKTERNISKEETKAHLGRHCLVVNLFNGIILSLYWHLFGKEQNMHLHSISDCRVLAEENDHHKIPLGYGIMTDSLNHLLKYVELSSKAILII